MHKTSNSKLENLTNKHDSVVSSLQNCQTVPQKFKVVQEAINLLNIDRVRESSHGSQKTMFKAVSREPAIQDKVIRQFNSLYDGFQEFDDRKNNQLLSKSKQSKHKGKWVGRNPSRSMQSQQNIQTTPIYQINKLHTNLFDGNAVFPQSLKRQKFSRLSRKHNRTACKLFDYYQLRTHNCTTNQQLKSAILQLENRADEKFHIRFQKHSIAPKLELNDENCNQKVHKDKKHSFTTKITDKDQQDNYDMPKSFLRPNTNVNRLISTSLCSQKPRQNLMYIRV